LVVYGPLAIAAETALPKLTSAAAWLHEAKLEQAVALVSVGVIWLLLAAGIMLMLLMLRLLCCCDS